MFSCHQYARDFAVRQVDNTIASDNQREKTLQDYIDKISDLLLKEHLSELTADGKLEPKYNEVRNIARVHTLTVLRGLDAIRKASVLQFLQESGLVDKNKLIINLNGADLRGDDLSEADLSGVHLGGARLWETDLSGAILERADLSNADLSAANLSWADLIDTDLSGADLKDATGITAEELEK